MAAESMSLSRISSMLASGGCPEQSLADLAKHAEEHAVGMRRRA